MEIVLIRHAKSSWKTNELDHDRPLATKGINDAQLVFEKFKNFLPNVPLILCSSSTRTTQTAKIFASICKIPFDTIVLKKELYTFDSNELEKMIRKNNNVNNLIIFGHNNAITDFVTKFGDYYIENVPTCGIVILKFENSNTISPKKGVIIKTIFPRDLK